MTDPAVTAQQRPATSVGWPIALPALDVCDSAGAFSVLRLWRPAAAMHAELGRAFGLDWPTRPNTWAGARSATVLWLTPAEWAIVGMEHGEVVARTAIACGAALHDVVDVSAGRVRFDLSGGRARELLAKGCSLDLHPLVFVADACAQTLLAQVPVLIAGTIRADSADAAPALRLWADASLAHYLRAWFSDAALEYA